MNVSVLPFTADIIDRVLISVYGTASVKNFLKNWIHGSRTPIESMASWGTTISLVAKGEGSEEYLGLLLGYSIPVRSIKVKINDIEIEEYFKPAGEHEINKIFTAIYDIHIKPDLENDVVNNVVKHLIREFIKYSRKKRAERIYCYLRIRNKNYSSKRLQIIEQALKEYGFNLIGITKIFSIKESNLVRD